MILALAYFYNWFPMLRRKCAVVQQGSVRVVLMFSDCQNTEGGLSAFLNQEECVAFWVP